MREREQASETGKKDASKDVRFSLSFCDRLSGKQANNGDGWTIIRDTNLRLLLLSRLVLMESDDAKLNLHQEKL